MAPCSFILFTLLTFLLSLHGISAVEYIVTNVVPEDPGGIRFEKDIGIPYTKQIMEESTDFIWSKVFEQKDPSERKPLESVNVFIEQFKADERADAVAFMWDEHNINFSCVKIEKYEYTGEMKWDVKLEFTAVMYHEMTHVLQWGGGGKAPAELQEGIADYTKIKANLMQPGFSKPGEGEKWDEGYAVTARFLEYCDEVAPGFMPNLQKKMKDSYDEAFFTELTGKPLEQLWKDYKAKYGGGGGGGDPGAGGGGDPGAGGGGDPGAAGGGGGDPGAGGGGNIPQPARRLSSISTNFA